MTPLCPSCHDNIIRIDPSINHFRCPNCSINIIYLLDKNGSVCLNEIASITYKFDDVKVISYPIQKLSAIYYSKDFTWKYIKAINLLTIKNLSSKQAVCKVKIFLTFS